MRKLIEFCNLGFKNPLVVAASPATENICNIAKCAKAGAGAVILKSMGPREITQKGEYCPRRVFVKDGTAYIQSSSNREILDVNTGVKLIEESKKKIDIPVIASVCGLYDNPKKWASMCEIAKDAGADIVQLDTIYSVGLGNPIDRRVFSDLVSMAENIQNSIGKPVIIKISPNVHVQIAAEILKDRKLGVSLLDSLPVGIPPDIHSTNFSLFRGIQQHGKCLATGKMLFPLSLLYTQTLYRSRVGPVCAGGGIFSYNDALNLLVSGARLVQIATSVCLYGFNVIRRILNGLEEITDHYKNLDQLRIKFHSMVGNETRATYGKVIRRDAECGECDVLSCESAIMCGNGDEGCEGCGVCIDVCPQSKARFVALRNNSRKEKISDKRIIDHRGR